MCRTLRCLVAYLILSLGVVAQECREDDGVCQDTTPLECGMYMAESSIPNSGWGMYTAIPRKRGEVIHPTDVVIQVPDIDEHQRVRARKHGQKLPVWLLDEYYWNPETTHAFYDAADLCSIVPGLGMLANSHTGLVNAREQGPLEKQVVERHLPEAGAYSQYKGTTYTATNDIPVGHELMVQYGDSWFEERSHHLGDGIPLSHHFRKADRVLRQLEKFCSGKLDSDYCQDLWHLLRHDFGEYASPRLLNALPRRLDQVPEVLMSGTAYHSVPNVIRSVEWLQQNGICLDHIEPLPSKIPHAGTGAFATRNLPKGTIVAPAPVVHLHRGHMDMFFMDAYEEDRESWEGQQQLLNYLYGHPSTSLVFFPYSPVVNLINHSNEPNVKLCWSKRMAKPEWLNKTVDELITGSYGAGLMMEIVALRDIAKGEEVVLDYGRDWDEAWKKHVKEWKKPRDYKDHKPIELIKDQFVLPTENDDLEPLPPNAMTVCHLDLDEAEEGDNEHEFIWLPSTDTDDITETIICELIEREGSGKKATYTVEGQFGDDMLQFKKVPRKAIEIVDDFYTPNQFLKQSFRHYIELPDEMIPDIWKDV